MAPALTLCISSEVLPEIKEYERTSTTVINAYVRPIVEKYLSALTAELARIGVDAPLLLGGSPRSRHSPPGSGGVTPRSRCRRCERIRNRNFESSLLQRRVHKLSVRSVVYGARIFYMAEKCPKHLGLGPVRLVLTALVVALPASYLT